MGLTVALFTGFAWEKIENTEALVNHFRNYSGTSRLYNGDSSINVFGDLLSCAVGYKFARSVSEQFSPVIPLIFFSVLEIFMLVVFRDNMLLMFIQLFSPVMKIKEWQSKSPWPHFLLRLQGNEWYLGPHVCHWTTTYVSKLFNKYKPSRRISQSLLNPQVHYKRMMT